MDKKKMFGQKLTLLSSDPVHIWCVVDQPWVKNDISKWREYWQQVPEHHFWHRTKLLHCSKVSLSS